MRHYSHMRATIGDLLRYGVALAGPAGWAGAQFLLALILLRHLDAASFGRFSFLLIVAQLSLGIWSALFCAPLPLILARAGADGAAALVRAMASANLVAALLAFCVFACVARAVGEDWEAATLFAGFAALALLRWFARTLAYVQAQQFRVMVSDIVYSGVLLVGAALLFAGSLHGTAGTWLVFLIASLAGLFVFGPGFLLKQITAVRPRDLTAYHAVWRAHSRWSLLGVLTSEATSNAHAYLVTAFLGSGAFAPLAAGAVMIRPITVVANALTEFERARIGRALGAHDLDGAARAVRLFRAMMVLSWIATAIAAMALLAFDPRLIYPAAYDRFTLTIGGALWMATALIRILRTPESVLLQAGGWFRPLAITTVWSGIFSLAGVAALLVVAPPLWSIVGIALGEALCAVLIFRTAAGWAKSQRGEAS